MTSTLLINSRPDLRRVAHIADGVTLEFFCERARTAGTVGNVYKGRVVRVLPGMQCAFLEVGLSRTAFLFVGDALPATARQNDESGMRSSRPDDYPPINTVLREGQELVVQVTKDPIGTKGARVSTHIGLPGRYLVYKPHGHGVSVSRRITDMAERARLTEMGQRLLPETGGLIMRTVAQGLTDDDIGQDLALLLNVWGTVEKRQQTQSVPSLVHQELDLTLRSIRDLVPSGLDRILVDDDDEADRIERFVKDAMPQFSGQVERWSGPDPMFERFGLEWEISRAVRRHIWLRSGASITVDKTEAMTVVDVNSGKNVGRSSFEAMAFETNLEAAKEIAYQLRFRDIGGLIVIDFIDMTEVAHRVRVRDLLVEHLAKDRAPTRVLPMSDLGLIEMTRKRVRESAVTSLTERCFYCEGRGHLASIEVLIDGILSRVRQLVTRGDRDMVTVQAHPKLIERLVEDCEAVLTQIQVDHGVKVVLEPDQGAHLEQVEVQ